MTKKLENGRKAWAKPELIVLTRSRPEEAVLTNCKSIGSGSDLEGVNSGCYLAEAGCNDCYFLIDS